MRSRPGGGGPALLPTTAPRSRHGSNLGYNLAAASPVARAVRALEVSLLEFSPHLGEVARAVFGAGDRVVRGCLLAGKSIIYYYILPTIAAPPYYSSTVLLSQHLPTMAAPSYYGSTFLLWQHLPTMVRIPHASPRRSCLGPRRRLHRARRRLHRGLPARRRVEFGARQSHARGESVATGSI